MSWTGWLPPRQYERWPIKGLGTILTRELHWLHPQHIKVLPKPHPSVAIPDPRTSLWIIDCAVETLAYDFFYNWWEAHSVSNPGLCLRSTSSGKVTWIKSGLGLYGAQIWDELHSKQWGLWYQLVADLISNSHFLWLHCATFSLRNMQIQCGLSGFVPHSLLSLGLPFSFGPSALVSPSPSVPLVLLQLPQTFVFDSSFPTGTQASPLHQGNSTKQNCFQEPRVTVVEL